MNTTGSNLSTTKHHFEILDGLRGVAALAVVIFHFMEWVYTDPSKNFIGHGFLAVDFFFCLSGFVIAYSYDDRIARMGIKDFLIARAIRLHPLVVLGSVLGLLGFLFDPFSNHVASYTSGSIALLFLCSAFLIPYPVMQDRAFNLFGLNAPSWSLFWEYVASIVYAFILRRISRRALVVLTIISAAALGYVAHRAGNILGGWNGDTFWDGGVRIAYSFSAGMLIYRFNLIIKNKLGFVGLAVLLFLAFLMPVTKFNWVMELIVVLFYFPLMVSLGAGAVLSKGLQQICSFSGKMSYPLYMTHYSVLWIFGNYFTTHKPSVNQLAVIIPISIIGLIGLAYLAMVLYDVPLRKFLSSKRKRVI